MCDLQLWVPPTKTFLAVEWRTHSQVKTIFVKINCLLVCRLPSWYLSSCLYPPCLCHSTSITHRICWLSGKWVRVFHSTLGMPGTGLPHIGFSSLSSPSDIGKPWLESGCTLSGGVEVGNCSHLGCSITHLLVLWPGWMPDESCLGRWSAGPGESL